MQCHVGKHQGQSGHRRSVEGKGGQESLLWFLLERIIHEEQAGLGSASLNNLSGLWGGRDIPSYLVSALG